jgi:predicted cupin superfamily sugar epimerase
MIFSNPEPEQIITALNLQPLPFEGGWYAQTYKSIDTLSRVSLPERYLGPRALSTAIYFLMTATQEGFSALHRLQGDEILHYYLGDPIDSLLIHADGSFKKIVIGPDILNGQVVQLVIQAGTWQGHRVRLGGNFTLIGSTMAPGYEDEDFELGNRRMLCQQYPCLTDEIIYLTRE